MARLLLKMKAHLCAGCALAWLLRTPSISSSQIKAFALSQPTRIAPDCSGDIWAVPFFPHMLGGITVATEM